MKFGEELLLKRDKEWAAYYLDYAQLKAMIRSLEECIVNAGSKGSSLSVPMSPDTHTATSVDTPNASNLTHEQFFVTLEQVISCFAPLQSCPILSISLIIAGNEKDRIVHQNEGN